MSDALLNILLDGPFVLRQRPAPLPGDLRLAWGIALIVLILENSRGKKASLQKLHFLAHSARTIISRNSAIAVFNGTLRSADFTVRVEPWVNRALAFAQSMHLLTLVNGKSAQLSLDGSNIAKTLLASSVLSGEKDFLSQVKSRATEAAIEKIMRMETLL